MAENLFLHSIKNFKYFIRYHRKKLLIGSLVLAVIFSMLAFAKPPATIDLDNPGIMVKSIFDKIDEITNGAGVAAAAERLKVNFDVDAGVVNIGMNGGSVNLGGALKSINDMCKGIAFLFVICTFFIGLLSIRSAEQMDEEFMRRLAMIIFGFVLIVNAQTLSYALANIGTQVTESIASDVIHDDSNKQDVIELKKQIYIDTHQEPDMPANLGESIKTWFSNLGNAFSYNTDLFAPYIGFYICQALIMIVVWGRAFEIVLMATFSPLAFMEIPDIHHVGHGPGMRFIKNMLALSLSGAVILLVLIMGKQLSVTIMTGMSGSEFAQVMDSCWALLFLNLAMAGMVMKSTQLSRQIVGVG